MPDPDSIPDDVKWRLAAGFSAKLPFLYDRAFRAELGDRYDEIEQEVWMEAAASAFEIAKTLSLRVEIADTLRTIMVILFGPGFKTEVLDISQDGAVIVIKRCPFLSGRFDADSTGGHVFRKCMAFTLTAVPRLNRNFSVRFVRTMCTGDRQCEIKVAKSEPAAQGKTGKI